MFEFHQDKKKYFDINTANAKQYIMPFIEEKFRIGLVCGYWNSAATKVVC